MAKSLEELKKEANKVTKTQYAKMLKDADERELKKLDDRNTAWEKAHPGIKLTTENIGYDDRGLSDLTTKELNKTFAKQHKMDNKNKKKKK
ncbi:MAG: hypothetical protein LBN34_09745 [Clostridiales Family XIII bacterium]|jgi:hypothetical protein|nr:hypothetical protein [Clostridiales Family XIII bacterium]